jgi:hypothetical protein
VIEATRQADIMTGSLSTHDDPRQAALLQGRREGLATAALAAGCVAFINLLGAEKALLAMTLAGLALGGLPAGSARGRALAALGLSAVYIATLVTVLIFYHDKLAHLLRLLKDLG